MFYHKSRLRMTAKASQEQKDAATQNQAFTTNLQNMFQSSFANSTAMQSSLNNQLQSLNGVYQKQYNAGQAGQGYTPAEESALRSQALTSSANGQVQAQQAAGQQIADKSDGGALTSGAVAAQAAQNANIAAQQNSNNQLNITNNNAALARQNTLAGEQGLSGTAGQQAGLVNTATSQADGLAGAANNSAANSYQQISQAYQPSNFWGNLAGGVVSAGLGAVAGPASTFVGNLMNGGSGVNMQPQGAMAGDTEDDDYVPQ